MTSYIINQPIKIPKKSIEYLINNKKKKISVNLYTMEEFSKVNDVMISENNNVEIFFSYINNFNTISTYVKEYNHDNKFSVKEIIKLIRETMREALEYEFDITESQSMDDVDSIRRFVVNEELKLHNLAKFSYIENNFGFKVYI